MNFAEASRVVLSFQTKLVSLLCFCAFDFGAFLSNVI